MKIPFFSKREQKRNHLRALRGEATSAYLDPRERNAAFQRAKARRG